jgi:hypothetical protein
VQIDGGGHGPLFGLGQPARAAPRADRAPPPGEWADPPRRPRQPTSPPRATKPYVRATKGAPGHAIEQRLGQRRCSLGSGHIHAVAPAKRLDAQRTRRNIGVGRTPLLDHGQGALQFAARFGDQTVFLFQNAVDGTQIVERAARCQFALDEIATLSQPRLAQCEHIVE